MPTKQEHLSKSQIAADAQLTLETDSKDHSDWVVITAFYSALHWVHAFFESKNHPLHKRRTHQKLEIEISKCADLHPIQRNYKRLYDASRVARYNAKIYHDGSTEVKNLLQVDLPAVVTYINGLINPTQT